MVARHKVDCQAQNRLLGRKLRFKDQGTSYKIKSKYGHWDWVCACN